MNTESYTIQNEISLKLAGHTLTFKTTSHSRCTVPLSAAKHIPWKRCSEEGYQDKVSTPEFLLV